MILVIGATGQVGSALLRTGSATTGIDRGRLDLATASHDDVAALLRATRPSHIVNSAAYTAVDHAESERGIADRVNGDSVGVLAEVASRLGIPLVTYSTDYVFPGTSGRPYREDDPVDPINAYGASKLLGERLALEHEGVLVIRTSWVISGTHPNFVATMLRLAAEGKTLRVVADQKGRPTVADDLAAATVACLRLELTGLLHLANQGETTWFDLASRSVELAGLDTVALERCSTSDYPAAATRPSYSVLDTRLAESHGVALPEWEASLPAVVAELRSAAE
jgi:dTDP-4-dehydrorhamnose reductase